MSSVWTQEMSNENKAGYGEQAGKKNLGDAQVEVCTGDLIDHSGSSEKDEKGGQSGNRGLGHWAASKHLSAEKKSKQKGQGQQEQIKIATQATNTILVQNFTGSPFFFSLLHSFLSQEHQKKFPL